ncbi:MBL fold metallo-hydrolase [Pseudomonas gingeri]|uniref:MBL fold metallo-hydrolase n=1 Tax=Pseudomonas gingeri TaxID=117681 RepID=UPI0015A05B27|nr:MBL fold metallo-hydrolase [Pseudomonas gingeri]NWD04125.1 MBL fold metallo-hydrolase [Pseudomonas gingeri]NWE34243.1 MBL fold metallo-hydrolase [Pseudomonas gingeri]NWE56505.1 MBL fold metallo-hydrolase [Pseudomonas gingeri]NWF05721.1 MBL fold metallo-hydrolase [Pseudomonas gingeri]
MFGSAPFKRVLLASIALGFTAHTLAADLTLDAYNPGPGAISPVSSVLVSGEHDAILVDAQFDNAAARELVDKIHGSGKKLTTIYISQGDPDYYFGLDTLTSAFPNAKVVAPAPVVEHIKATAEKKLEIWGPKLGANKPAKAIIPEVLQGHTLTLEGKKLEVIGLDGKQPERTFVWIPSIRAVIGGTVVAQNTHVWMADTQSPQSHADWLATLATIEKLKPLVVVPGHYRGEYSLKSVPFTVEYIKAFDLEAAKAKSSAELIKSMEKRYPGLADEGTLELGAKVAKGEIKW